MLFRFDAGVGACVGNSLRSDAGKVETVSDPSCLFFTIGSPPSSLLLFCFDAGVCACVGNSLRSDAGKVGTVFSFTVAVGRVVAMFLTVDITLSAALYLRLMKLTPPLKYKDVSVI